MTTAKPKTVIILGKGFGGESTIDQEENNARAYKERLEQRLFADHNPYPIPRIED